MAFPLSLVPRSARSALQAAQTRPGVRRILLATDNPNAIHDTRAGTLRSSDYLRTPLPANTPAAFDV